MATITMAKSPSKLFSINLENPSSRKSYAISIAADGTKFLKTDKCLIRLKSEEAKNLEYAKLISDDNVDETIEALDPDINFDESIDELNENTIEDSAFKWSHEAILLLIEEYRKHKPNVYSGKISQKKLWEKISNQLNTHGHNVTGPQCQSKFSGMKRTYKNIKDHNGRSGSSAKTWPYFTLIDDLLGDNFFVTPVVTCSSTGKRTRTNFDYSSDSVYSEQDASIKKIKLSSTDQILSALEKCAKKIEENKERRFNELLSFKERKAKEDFQLKSRALDLLERIINSQN